MKNLTKIKYFRPRGKVKFLVTLTVGLIVCSLIALQMEIVPGISSAKAYKTSWVGNSFSGKDKWVQNFIEGMYVAPDGTVYTNSKWDEAGREAGVYKNGDAIGKLDETHGWGRGGGVAVTANGKYVYMAMVQGNEGGGLTGDGYPPKGKDWYVVRRYGLDYKPAAFEGGRGHDNSMLIVSESGPVTGLASAGNELYVSDSAANRIRVYDIRNMKPLRSWAFSRPGQIAVDRKGNLWIIQTKSGKNTPKILQYSKTGKLLPAKVTDVVDPMSVAVDKQGRLLVTENGPRQQVLIYNIAGTPKLVGTFGAKGGIYTGTRGQVGDLKLYGLTGVGTDAAGNLYVSSNGFKGAGDDLSGSDLRKFSARGALQWRLLGLPFVDVADADPATDGKDVFTKHEHFVMDYSKPTGKEWSYKAYTLDSNRYPNDPRLHNKGHSTASVFVRRLGGKRFLYVLGMFPTNLSIYRFDGEIAVPSGMIAVTHGDWPKNQPAKGSWLWRDRNGDGSFQSNEYENLGDEDGSIWGWEVDSKGNVWQASESGMIRQYRYQGLDTHGSPIYSNAAKAEMRMPPPFKQLARLKYFPQTDVMYLAGYTSDRPKTGEEWGIAGTEIIRYDNWSKGKKLRWRADLPYDPKGDPERVVKAIDVAGDRVFAVVSRTAEVSVYDAKTGKFIQKLTPGPEVGGESGWIDIPYGLRAYRRANGEYQVFVEEDARAKVIMYRLPS